MRQPRHPVRRAVALIAALFLFPAGPGFGDTVIDGFASAQHDRFANDPSFIADGFDLSGVALTNGGRWVTMISPNVYLSATHYKPGLNDFVTFHATNDPTGPTATRQIASTRQQISGTDLWIGTLDAPLPSSYGYYAFADQPITNQTEFNTILGGKIALMAGRSPTGFTTSRDMAFGINVLDALFGTVSTGGTTGIAVGEVYNEPTDALYVASEQWLQSGDSGGPMFTVSGPNLILTGIHWFIADVSIDPDPFDAVTESAPRNASGQTYTGNYASAINTFLNLYSVPEPNTAILLLIGSGLLCLRRR